MNHNITPRQLSVLVSCYFGQPPHWEATSLYGGAHEKAGEPYWRPRTNMGGAVRRMVDDLADRGFITTRDRHDPHGDKSDGDLTVKGYDALQERLDRLPALKDVYGNIIYKFSIDEAEIAERKRERNGREAEMIRLRAQAREEERRQFRAAALKRRAKKLTELRALFADRGIADNWSDEDVLSFGEQVGDVLMGS